MGRLTSPPPSAHTPSPTIQTERDGFTHTTDSGSGPKRSRAPSAETRETATNRCLFEGSSTVVLSSKPFPL